MENPDNSFDIKARYEAALYKAATRAASVVEAGFAQDKTAYAPLESNKIELALRLLAIVEGV